MVHLLHHVLHCGHAGLDELREVLQDVHSQVVLLQELHGSEPLLIVVTFCRRRSDGVAFSV